jgi:hypothetical protein
MRLWHRHRWEHCGQPVERLVDIPEGSMFYRLDCTGCERQIDGAALRQMVGTEPPGWLRRRLGFKR